MKKLMSMALALCLALSIAAVPASAAFVEQVRPTEILTPFVQRNGSMEVTAPGAARPQLLESFDFGIPGDFRMYTLTSGKFMYEGDPVTVSGMWYPDYGMQVRLLREDGGRALTVGLGTGDSFTFTVPETGIYSLQVSSHYDIGGTLNVIW